MALQMRFQSLGLMCDLAENGLELLKLLERQHYDILITDIYMPEINGVTAIEYIREAFPTHLQPYIIAMTADSQVEMRDQLFQAGANDILVKPTSRKAILQVIETYQTSKQPAQLVQSSQPSGESILDESLLQDFLSTMGNKANSALMELLDSYLNHTPSLIAEMKNKLQHKDWNGLKSTVHAIKGNSALFGAVQLTQTCRQLEEHLQRYELETIPSQVSAVEQEYLWLRLALQNKKEQLTLAL